jgi:hypothetical protein
MQTKLFDLFEEVGPGNPAIPTLVSTGSNLEKSSSIAEFSYGATNLVGQEDASAAIVCTLKNAVYGIHNNEFWTRNGLATIGFSDLVRESSGHLVLPIDPGSEEDMSLLRHLSKSLTDFVRMTQKSGQCFSGKRINDVGKRLECVIAAELRRTPIEAYVLGRPGYPDCLLKQGDRVTYLEIKTSASILKGTNKYLRVFSFSSGKKIKCDARHLLLKVQLVEEGNQIWRAVAWELRDLSTLKTRLRTEFNARSGDLAEVRMLGSSTKTIRSSSLLNGQSFLDGSSEMTSGRRRQSTGQVHIS